MDFGRALKEYRIAKRLTLRELSDRTGYPVGTLSRIENQKVKPHDLTKAKIQDALSDFRPERELAAAG